MTQALETLLPCGWCGTIPQFYFGDGLVRCSNNACPIGQGFTTDEWNTRKPCDAGLREALTDADDTLDKLHGALREEDFERHAQALAVIELTRDNIRAALGDAR